MTVFEFVGHTLDLRQGRLRKGARRRDRPEGFIGTVPRRGYVLDGERLQVRALHDDPRFLALVDGRQEARLQT